MDRKGYKALIASLIVVASSCMKDKPAAVKNTEAPGTTGDVYVVCQGEYGSGNSSLYAYDSQNDSVYGDIFEEANHQPMGDVFQSMTKIGNNFFLCINNSDKVIVVNAGSKKTVSVISVPQPRYILSVSSDKAYVSSLYHNKVYVINTQAYTVTDSILLPDMNTEGMCLYNNEVAVCTWDTSGNHIYMIDDAADMVVQSIKVAGYAPQSALVDKEQMLWVLAGDQPEGKIATLTRVDPSTGDMLASYTFPSGADPLNPIFNKTKDTLYFIEANYDYGTANNGIFRMGIHEQALPGQAFIPAGQNQYFYALGISPATGYLFVGDPKGFVQKGSVFIYKPDGTQVTSFNVGLGPGGFYFDE